MTNLSSKQPDRRTPNLRTEQEQEQSRLKRRMLLSSTVQCASLEEYREDFRELFNGMEPPNPEWVTTPIRCEQVKRIKVDTIKEKEPDLTQDSQKSGNH